MTLRFLQINLNCCKVAQQLMLQTATEKRANILIISEPNRNCKEWYADTEGKAAIALLQGAIPEQIGKPGKGYAWLRYQGIRIYSCYVSPNITMAEYIDYLQNLEASIRSENGEVILAGDFNAKNAEWGSATNDKRGDELSALIATLDLYVCNKGATPTFERGRSSSVLDVTFATQSTAAQIIEWTVLNEETRSDHMYLQYNVGTQAEKPKRLTQGWAWKKLNIQKMKEYLNNNNTPANASGLMEVLTSACNASMPKRNYRQGNHEPQYWWTQEIADKRKLVLAARRRYQRAAKRGTSDDEHLHFKEAKKRLRIAIRESQENCWKRLCAEVDHDPWGAPYKIVMKKVGSRKPVPSNLVPSIVDELFPVHPKINERASWPAITVPRITSQELELGGKRLRAGKAPGPDGIPNEVLKIAIKLQPQMFLRTFDSCLQNGIFPKEWKMARLVLIRKGDKPEDLPSSYRPLCMLDTTGKLFERILCNRIEEYYATSSKGLSNNQYGFRKGRSTVDAITSVMEEVTIAGTGSIYERQLCVLVTLDVANAFNSASWARILQSLQSKQVPDYLIRILQSYLSDRRITYGESQTQLNLSSGVPQGSVLGPLLWGTMYDELLSLEMPEGVKLIGFADDVALVGRGWRTEQLEERVNSALKLVSEWMRDARLRLAVSKTEAVMLTRKRDYRRPTFVLGDQVIKTTKSLKYLGVEIDDGRRFKIHEEKVGAKAMKTAQALARILPNLRGPSTAKRILLSTVVHSQILYAAPIWMSALECRADSTIPIKGDVARHIKKAQRLMAIRITRAYRTVSYEASTLIASTPPILLLGKERASCRSKGVKRKDNAEARLILLQDWQKQWDSSNKGRWTYKLIPNVEKWVNRRHGDVDYFITQALTNHGCFNAYLWKIQKLDSPQCSLCGAESDDAQHTLFECDAFENWRRQLVGEVGLELTPDNLIDAMLEEKWKWEMIAAYVRRVMTTKCDEERRRQAT